MRSESLAKLRNTDITELVSFQRSQREGNVLSGSERFGSVSIINHRLLGAIVIALLASGPVIGRVIGDGPLRNALLGPHEAVGVLVPAGAGGRRPRRPRAAPARARAAARGTTAA